MRLRLWLFMEEKNYITPYGLKRLVNERDFLLKVENTRVLEVVSWAFFGE